MAASSACLIGSGLSVRTTKQRSKQLGLSSTLASVDRASKCTRVVKASLDVKKHEARRGFFKLLLGNAAAAGAGLLASGKANADEQGVSSSRMSYSRFLEYLDKGRVEKVDLYENGTIAIVEAVSPELGNRIQRVRVQLPGLSQELLQKLRAKNIDFAAHNAQEDQGSPILNLIGNLAFPVILIGGLFLLSRRSSGGMGGPGGPGFPLQLGQSKAKFQMEPNTGVTFDDVAGVDEAKQDFMEVVEFLKKPERFTAVGARIPKGVLLVGPPGTGKTLLAKAIAGEAGVPFFSISGSEFVEMFVGVGASRVRDLFKKAKENAPCIVFVDEIDAVGRQRGTGIGGGNDEREQTLNQLLTEMDGFEGNTGVIVVAATNRADILDSALLRPGRFDRQVSVDVPDVKGRTDILKVHSGNKKFDNGVSLEVIAMRTPGFSGADLANLLNEAAILAGRRGKTAISSKEIDDSIDRIVAGMEGTVMTDGKSKSLVAYHEVGHAVCGTLTPGHDAVQKVTLIPRGQARGLTWFIPSDDPTLISKQQLFARIVGGLGGRAAEEVIFGEPEVTTGAVGDLQQITGLAKQMVVTFGMSEIGPWSLMDSSAQSDVIMRMMARNSMSERLAEDIDSAVKKLSDSAYEIALSHIRNNREAMDKLVEVLLEKETIGGDEFRAILSEFTEIPPENRVPVSTTSTPTSTPTPASV
uniref:ATP-dependent zinc metalloprotease FTSH 8, chloroplastic n=3 Tax=Noccaea caerulescens TaxID=107243 RepID=A0A1J3GZ60_NOCCA